MSMWYPDRLRQRSRVCKKCFRDVSETEARVGSLILTRPGIRTWNLHVGGPAVAHGLHAPAQCLSLP